MNLKICNFFRLFTECFSGWQSISAEPSQTSRNSQWSTPFLVILEQAMTKVYADEPNRRADSGYIPVRANESRLHEMRWSFFVVFDAARLR